jgi:hypothetical protein
MVFFKADKLNYVNFDSMAMQFFEKITVGGLEPIQVSDQPLAAELPS